MTQATTSSVPTPPPTTDATGPNAAAVMPDSNAPSSFDVTMKIVFTADTRPRIGSGVSSCTSVPRTTTLTLSSAPITANIVNDRTGSVERPKAIVANPKPITDNNSD